MTTLINTAPISTGPDRMSIDTAYATFATRLHNARLKWRAYITERAIRKHFKDLDDHLIRDIGLDPWQVRQPRSEAHALYRALF